jgi:guanylate kinase
MSRQFPAKRLGVLMVVSGPSGSGKTTLCRKLADLGEVVYSISATTRAPRPGEAHGRDYYFFSEEEFRDNVQRGEFFDVVMDIDVQGAAQVRACEDELVQRCLVDVFIMPPSVESLRERLAGRGTESEEKLALRLQNALTEIEHWHEYQYALVSDTREVDLDRFRGLLLAERMRVTRLLD